MIKISISLILLAVCPWILISCQTEVERKKEEIKKPKVVEMDEAYKGIKLNIHVRHFFEDEEGKTKQGISPWVYSELSKEEREKYILRKDFRRHHEDYEHFKHGICDNMIKTIDPETGKMIIRCGGHTSTER